MWDYSDMYQKEYIQTHSILHSLPLQGSISSKCLLLSLSYTTEFIFPFLFFTLTCPIWILPHYLYWIIWLHFYKCFPTPPPQILINQLYNPLHETKCSVSSSFLFKTSYHHVKFKCGLWSVTAQVQLLTLQHTSCELGGMT